VFPKIDITAEGVGVRTGSDLRLSRQPFKQTYWCDTGVGAVFGGGVIFKGDELG